MPLAFSEGESAALPLSADMVQEPDKRDQKQEPGQQGAGCSESGQFVGDGGIPWVLFVYTEGNIAQLVMNAAQLALCQEQTGAAQFMRFSLIVEADSGPGAPACAAVERSSDDGVFRRIMVQRDIDGVAIDECRAAGEAHKRNTQGNRAAFLLIVLFFPAFHRETWS